MNNKALLIKRISPIIMSVLVFIVACFCFFNLDKTVMVSSNKETPIYFGNRNKNNVALMFNCYENRACIQEIAQKIEDYGFRCTFFFGGCFIDDNADLIVDLAKRGHEIGNHGYFHKEHSKLSYEQNYNEIKRTHDFILGVSGVEMNLFAPPSGDFSDVTIKVCKNLGYKVILWSKDTVDWRDKNVKTVYNRAVNKISGGDFVLMHPTPHTLEALDLILEFYKQNGFAVVTVSQCME